MKRNQWHLIFSRWGKFKFSWNGNISDVNQSLIEMGDTEDLPVMCAGFSEKVKECKIPKKPGGFN